MFRIRTRKVDDGPLTFGQYRPHGLLCFLVKHQRQVASMTWFGHCITNVTSALRALPPPGQLMLISDLRDFLDRQEQEIRRHQRDAKHKADGC
jgi:hypothetical protein